MGTINLTSSSLSGHLGLAEFAQMFGTTSDKLPPTCRQLIGQFNFAYTVLDAPARDATILNVLKILEADLPVSGKSRIARWEEGWGENLNAFINSGYDINTLTPGYYKSFHEKTRQVMRLHGEYVLPEDPDFETNIFAVLRAWLCETWLKDVDHVYEFGCGPAHNLAAFARIFPNKTYHGLDWARPSQEIINALAEAHHLPIDGSRFDLFAPDPTYTIAPRAAILTIGALEQVGANCEPFLQYCLNQSPQLCVHIEPLYELYDPDNLFDYLGARYHLKRGYLMAYLTHLRELEAAGKIQILYLKKHIGNLYQDSWNTVVFQPC